MLNLILGPDLVIISNKWKLYIDLAYLFPPESSQFRNANSFPPLVSFMFFTYLLLTKPELWYVILICSCNLKIIFAPSTSIHILYYVQHHVLLKPQYYLCCHVLLALKDISISYFSQVWFDLLDLRSACVFTDKVLWLRGDMRLWEITCLKLAHLGWIWCLEHALFR